MVAFLRRRRHGDDVACAGLCAMAPSDFFSNHIFKFQVPSLQANADVCDDTLHENRAFSIRQKA